MVIDKENGFLCPDKDKMHDSMLNLMENDHMLREFSENSRKLSLSFSDIANAKKTLRLYERVVNGHSGSDA